MTKDITNIADLTNYQSSNVYRREAKTKAFIFSKMSWGGQPPQQYVRYLIKRYNGTQNRRIYGIVTQTVKPTSLLLYTFHVATVDKSMTSSIASR